MLRVLKKRSRLTNNVGGKVGARPRAGGSHVYGKKRQRHQKKKKGAETKKKKAEKSAFHRRNLHPQQKTPTHTQWNKKSTAKPTIAGGEINQPERKERAAKNIVDGLSIASVGRGRMVKNPKPGDISTTAQLNSEQFLYTK